MGFKSRAQEYFDVKETKEEWRSNAEGRIERRVIAEELTEALSAGERRLQGKENERGRLERDRAQLVKRIEDARPYAESRFPSRARTGARDTVARCRRQLTELDAKLAGLL